MRYFVSGGTGFCGSHLTRKLLDLGHEVLITGREGEQPSNAICIGYDFHRLDWNAIGEVDAVFHQAAITNTLFDDSESVLRVNYLQSKRLFEEARTKRIIYASSCAVYGRAPIPFKEDGPKVPLNPYGYSKLYLDEYTVDFKRCPIVGLRYTNVYGHGENHKGKSACMISQIAEAVKEGRKPKLFKWGEQSRDFVFVDDVVQANLLALEAPSGVYNVGSGKPTTFNGVLKTINEVMGTNIEAEYIDNPIASVYQDFTQCDMAFSKERLKYEPSVSLLEGCKKLYG